MFLWVSVALALGVASLGSPPFGRFDAALTRIFTPRHAPEDAYRVYVSDERIEDVAAGIARASREAPPAGAWAVAPTELLEAFGSVPRWDRSRVARLYGGTFPRMARGPVFRDGQVAMSVTLVSPYPDASYERLHAGTLVIVTDLQRLQSATGSRVP
jgi:hypothetical protein